MKFSSFNIDKNLLAVLSALGYSDATPVQEKIIPKALKGHSMLIKAETGSGKTHSFLIPVFNALNTKDPYIQAIIVSPTYELSEQTTNFANKMAELMPEVKIKSLSKDVSRKELDQSINSEESISHIIIGTPGRVDDLIVRNKSLDLSHVKVLVFDESDMLMDEAYQENIQNLLKRVKKAQVLVFSATMDDNLMNQTKRFFNVHEVYEISNKTNTNVIHHLVNIKHREKYEALELFLNVVKPFYTLVFASKKDEVREVYEHLVNDGFNPAILSGDMELRERKIMMRRIKNDEFNLIIASDMASRGLDIPTLTTVISLDLPYDLNYYYHRSGRTGRNKKKGDSYVFYNDDNKKGLNNLLKTKIKFDYFVLKQDELKRVVNLEGKPQKRNSEVLEKEIKKQIHKVKTNKVKPNYKKKIKIAIKQAKENHRRDVIKKNIIERKKRGEKVI